MCWAVSNSSLQSRVLKIKSAAYSFTVTLTSTA
jgi:hypothetical protein